MDPTLEIKVCDSLLNKNDVVCETQEEDVSQNLPIELTLDDIFINLTLISKIDIGNKLVRNGKYVNIDSSYFSFFSRWIYGNNRKETIEFITLILNKSFDYCSELVSINTIESAQHSLRLNSDLKNSINGLTNLKLTYSYDKLVQSEIDVMIDNIRSKLDLHFKNLNYNPLTTIVSSSPIVVPHIESDESVSEVIQPKREISKKERKHYPVIYE